MAIVLDHTIVPAHDNIASAMFFARIFGLPYEGVVSHFAPVRVNETLVLDFDTRTTFDWQHYAFKVSDGEFDEIFQRGWPWLLFQGSKRPSARSADGLSW